MNWNKFRWVFPAVTAAVVFLGYSLFSLSALMPELSKEVAVAVGLRPASGVFPGLWRYLAAALPPSAAAFGLIGRVAVTAFALLVYFTMRRVLLMVHRAVADAERMNYLFIPSIAAVCTIMGVFAEPIWRAFVQFSPAALTLLFVATVFRLLVGWIDRGGWWRLCGGLALTGVFSAETPLAPVVFVIIVILYLLVWHFICNGNFAPRRPLTPPDELPKWRMFLSFVGGLLLGGYANIGFIATHDIAGALGWRYTYVVFHYWQQYLVQIKAAASLYGWMLGVPLCVVPFLIVSRMVPTLTDDDRPVPFASGVVALFCGLIAYFEQGHLRGAWFWTWLGEKEIVTSGALLGFFSMLSTWAFAFVTLIFVVDAFNPRRSEFRERGVNLTYRVAVGVLAAVVVVLTFCRMPHSDLRRVVRFNDEALKETYRELNGAKYVFTDGSADALLELEAMRNGQTLYTIDLLNDSRPNAVALRLRGLTDEGDVIAAKIGASALLRVWACDKPNGLDEVALQLGFSLWKREKRLVPPTASAFVARVKGFREEDVRDASAIAKEFSDRILSLTAVANAVDVPSSVRDLFYTFSWRLSRFSRYRKEVELADRLDSENLALRRMLSDLEYARLQAFLQMTPKEGLEIALRRSDFQDAARYAAAVLKIDKDDPQGNFGMGMYFLMANRYEDAEPFLRRVLVRRPNEPAVLNNLSIICRKTRRYEEAVKLAKSALEALPGNADVEQTLKDAENKAP